MTGKMLKQIILTSTSQASKKSRVFKLHVYGKGYQCHSNHSLQLFELKKKATKNKSRYLNI